MKAFKYRIYPTRNQTNTLNTMFDECRQLHNFFLEQRKNEYKTNGKSVSKYDQMNQLPGFRKKLPELKEIYSQVLQEVIKRLDKAYRNFFRRVKNGEKPGFPRFKGKGQYHSIMYPQDNGSFKLVEDNTKIQLSGIGCVKIKYHRETQGVIKSCTVTKSATGKWYVSICCDKIPKKILPKTGKKVGVDVGLKTFVTLSNGETIERKRFFKEEQKNLAKEQRKLAKLPKGSKESRNQRLRVAKVHERITNKREDFVHKASTKLVKEYDEIAMEHLNIVGMQEQGNTGINKSIQDVSWNRFRTYTNYKAENAGKKVKEVDPKDTSKTCNKCGNVKKHLSLSERVYKCEICGHEEDRDLNAAKNILCRAIQSSGCCKAA